MKQHFLQKIALAMVLFLIIAFGVLSIFTPWIVQKYTLRQEAYQMHREAKYLASDYNNPSSTSTGFADYQEQLESIGRYLFCDVWIVSPAGDILFSSSEDNPTSFYRSSNSFIQIDSFDITDFGNSYYSIGLFDNYFNESTLTVFAPITTAYSLKGYVLLHKPTEPIQEMNNQIIIISYQTVSILLLIIVILSLIWAFFYQKGLNRILNAATKYSKGDFSVSISSHREDELGYISQTMNYMAEELNTLEEDERKFISNVSHDFRSPLTSIKGYVEAIQDGTIPVEMQDKYLNIIIFETERLTKLTQDLLDLNKMGHKGVRLDIADFDINQMIRTTILTFEGICQKKGLSFDLFLTGDELFVTGDLSKIQQVLYNLIDNATKFSHNDGTIKIETNIIKEKVFISVKDHGIGIPSDSIKKIWERFYKTDHSRGKDKKGTGLGLSIVKEIIQAHGEHINVVSTEGVGTEFIFSLPLSKTKERL